MKVVLLAGGKGTRLSEETSLRPKPMVTIGGIPILVHIMRCYASAGHTEFVVACGHLGHVIKDYFSNYRTRHSDFTLSLRTGEIRFHEDHHDDWTVTLIDTGIDTMTGGRLSRVQDYVGDETFMMTYGDGLADIDIPQLVKQHQVAGRIATVTAVRPPARFGSLTLAADGSVTSFEEKISSSESFINGGFFVFEPAVFDYVDLDTVPFEREPMERLAADNELNAFRHEGFWKPMDTLRDRMEFESMWASGSAPWIRQ